MSVFVHYVSSLFYFDSGLHLNTDFQLKLQLRLHLKRLRLYTSYYCESHDCESHAWESHNCQSHNWESPGWELPDWESPRLGIS